MTLREDIDSFHECSLVTPFGTLSGAAGVLAVLLRTLGRAVVPRANRAMPNNADSNLTDGHMGWGIRGRFPCRFGQSCGFSEQKVQRRPKDVPKVSKEVPRCPKGVPRMPRGCPGVAQWWPGRPVFDQGQSLIMRQPPSDPGSHRC